MSSAIRSMHIVCPNCTTSYAVDAAGFGASGRNVRCARCKEVWLAQPEDLSRADMLVSEPESEPAPDSATRDEDLGAWGLAAEDGNDTPAEDIEAAQIPLVDSPSISSDWPSEPHDEPDWAIDARPEPAKSKKRKRTRQKPGFAQRMPFRMPFRMPVGLRTGCVGMAAIVIALLVWRTDIVRVLPQTAGFYNLVGLNVNLRALAFKDLKVTTETVDGKPVLVIEGVVVGESRKPVELPRLRFIVRDAQGTEIYAWNAVLEQPVLNPGERAWFRSRLASPPAEGRAIDVRFFNRRDIGA